MGTGVASSVEEVLNMTFAEIHIGIAACKIRDERRFSEVKTLAWFTGYLSRTKDFPTLDNWLNPPKAEIPSDEEAAQLQQDYEFIIEDLWEDAK